jgi:protein tyrosine/serine phosphatase
MNKLRSYIISAFLLFLFLSGGYAAYILKTGNFHEITQGEAYRSAQLDRDELQHCIKKYNIKTIVNLRGENPDQKWYREEMAVSKEFNVAHYDVSLSASLEPDGKDIRKLMEIFESAPRPVLIHCQAGADRSGLVAAMWKVIVDKETKTSAEKQLTIWHGHIPLGGTIAMDRFFEKWTAEQYSH